MIHRIMHASSMLVFLIVIQSICLPSTAYLISDVSKFKSVRGGPPSSYPLRLQMSAVNTHDAFGVMITGGAGGVGYAYADEMLRLGHKVVICDVRDCTPAVESLQSKHSDNLAIYGMTCDVCNYDDVRALGAFAKEKLAP